MNVRLARLSELPTVMTVLDSAMLAGTAAEVRGAIAADRTLVGAADGRVIGALVVEPESATDTTRIVAIAVRRSRRGQGVGTALVRAAADRYGSLVAEFDADVRPFWASLGFDIEPAPEPGRYEGTLAGDTGQPV